MYVINLDEKKRYEFSGEKYAEQIINDMFKAYFQRTYQKSTVESLLKDMWKNIEIEIPKQVIFLWKDEKLYYIAEAENKNETENEYEDEDEYEDGFMRFEIAPRCFFRIKKDTHKVLKLCFEECNEKFARTMQNITSEAGWKSTSFTMMNLRYKHSWEHIKWICEDLKESLKNKQRNFESFVGKSLKEELCEEVAFKMLKQYRKILLENNPIMFMTNAYTEEMYAIDNELTAKRVVFFSIQEELEAIVGEILPSDYEFLVNRIYNYITFPKEEIPPQIRLKKVTKNGSSGVIYGEKGTFPIVESKEGKYFTIVTIKPNEKMDRVKERIGSAVSIKSNELIVTDSISIIRKIDKSILPEYGYIEVVDNCYTISHGSYTSQEKSNFNHIYLFENNKCKEVFDCKYGCITVSETEANKIKEFYKEEKDRVHYACFQIIPKY